jgi:hypothetical protein
MAFRNGAGSTSATTDSGARIDFRTGKSRLFSRTSKNAQVHRLHRGRSHRSLVEVMPDDTTGLWLIAWPDGGVSASANLSRCRDVAREWAEHQALTADRKLNAARRLKSLNNFWWSSSLVRQNGRGRP